jgi:hypothetical protein
MEETLLSAFREIDPTRFVSFIRKDHSEISQQFKDTTNNHFKKLLSEYITTDNGLTWEETFTIVDKTAEECLLSSDQRLEMLEHQKTSLLEYATLELTNAIDIDKQMYQTYIDTLNVFVITDPFTTRIPGLPRKDENGNWITVSNKGAKPSVIG